MEEAMSLRQFIDTNRRQGSTTELLRAALLVDGYLVVHNVRTKNELIDQYPMLRAVTVNEIREGRLNGCEPRAVFVDVHVLWYAEE